MERWDSFDLIENKASNQSAGIQRVKMKKLLSCVKCFPSKTKMHSVRDCLIQRNVRGMKLENTLSSIREHKNKPEFGKWNRKSSEIARRRRRKDILLFVLLFHILQKFQASLELRHLGYMITASFVKSGLGRLIDRNINNWWGRRRW